MESLSYHPHLERLTQFASGASRTVDLLSAKKEYFKLTGEVFEDDKMFEMRMASFLDYYLMDRPSPESQKTPAQEFLEEIERDQPGEAAIFRGFTQTIHGLFEVKKLSPGKIKLRELFSGKDYDVTERRQLAGLEKGDLLEARLIPFNGHLMFSAAFCYHPKEASKAILKEVKRRRKKEPGASPKEFAWECSKRALKMERYKQIPVERIYDFENPTPL